MDLRKTIKAYKELFVVVLLLGMSTFLYAGFDVQISTSGGCSNTRMDYTVDIYNTGTVPVDMNNLCVRLYFLDATHDASGMLSTTGYTDIQPWDGDGTNASHSNTHNNLVCSEANTYLEMCITTATTSGLVGAGRFVHLTGQVWWGDNTNPFDDGSDNWTPCNIGMGSNSHAVLFDGGSIVDEEISTGVPDPDTGVEPCSIPSPTPTNTLEHIDNIALSSNAAGTPFMTSIATVEIEDETPTFTPTPTMTLTITVTVTRTITLTQTMTVTRTSTPTITPTNTPTVSFTSTPSVTPTVSFTATPTMTPTFTPTVSFTNTPSMTPTFTPTVSFTSTPTFTPTVSFTSTPTNTETSTPTVSFTSTPTVTITFMATMTNTPTITETNTPTVSFTSTPTYTPTFTETVTFTNTPTATPTVSFTNTQTVTPTVTPTVSFTITPTDTPTPTITRTYWETMTITPTITETSTPTVSFTITKTNTPTSTFTRTSTPTVSFTSTPTFTPSSTVTLTVTPTVSFTSTPTFTPTPTITITYWESMTNTQTITETNTPTVSFTITYTITLTSTKTFTPTVTLTSTPTPTITVTFFATYTNTPTMTQTNTPSYTSTVTPTTTKTATETVTFSSTPTATPTSTISVTTTNTKTATPTFTKTSTPTNTAIHTATSTMTFTQTYTPTFTKTVTQSVTPTNTPPHTYTTTPTMTETFTETMTPTITVTSTVTLTPVPFPYTLTIMAFNEAGEEVRLIAHALISDSLKNILMTTGGQPSTVFNPSKTELELIFSEIMTPDQMTANGVVFKWDGKSNNGQDIGNGVYYLQISTKDEYGHTETINLDVQLIRSEEYVRVSVYNTAGELIRRLEEPKTTDTAISLGVEDVLYIGKDSQEIIINYAQNETMIWDGTNTDGRMVDSGVYEIQVEVKSEDGYTTYASKTVTILNDGTKEILGEVKVYPNPFVIIADVHTGITLEWTELNEGIVKIRIYNIAGELVKMLNADMLSLRTKWDINTASNEPAASGMYIVIFEGRKATGETEIKRTKLVILRKLDASSGEDIN